MDKIKLADYAKTKTDKNRTVTTGINIELIHKKFLEDQGINLSALVRDVLDSLMTEVKK